MAVTSRSGSSSRARLLLWPLLLVGAGVLLTACESPRIIAVNTTVDGSDVNPADGVCEMTVGVGDCSLRAAIDEANAATGTKAVTIAVPSGTYALTVSGVDDTNAAGDLDLFVTEHGVNIEGASPGVRVDAGGQEAAIDVRGGQTDLYGFAFTGASGPGIDVHGGRARLFRGAGFANGGAGARVAAGAVLHLESVTLSGNGAGGASVAGTLNVSYSTITANTGGGISGPGVTNSGADLINEQLSGPDCSGSVVSNGGYNLDSDGSCGFGGPGDVTVPEVDLAPLSATVVPYHRPNPGSAAIGVIGTGPTCGPGGPLDATGAPRPIGVNCDRGALEANYTSAPTANADTGSVGEDGPGVNVDVLGNDTDPDTGDSKTVTVVDTAGTSGSVTNNGDDVGYDPNGAFESLAVGESASDTFGYTMVDAVGNTASAVVTVTVAGANDGPTANADSGTVDASGPAITVDVLGNDTDPDTTDTLSVQSVDTTGTLGSVTNNGTNITYDPNNQFPNDPNSLFGPAAVPGATDTFSYTAVDPHGATSTATVTITVTGINHAPVAVDDSASVNEGGPAVTVDVLANDTDADLVDTKAVQSVGTTGTLGSVTNNGTDVTYDPNGAFESLGVGATATDTFTYTVVDANGATATATVTVTVTGENDSPVAVDDTASVGEDGPPVMVFVLANDTDPDAGDSKTVQSVNNTGTLGQAQSFGTFVGYDPGAAFNSLKAGATATDAFTYTMVDSQGATASATVTVTITGQNDAPTAVADTATMNEDATNVAIDVLGNDTDPDNGDSKTVQSVGALSNGGSLTNNGTNVTFTPGASFQDLQVGSTRDTSFSYTMVDGSGVTSNATVTITVTGVNDAPVAVNDGTYTGVVGNTKAVLGTTGTGPVVTLTGNVVSQNDTDVDAADTKTASLVSANSANVTVNANGSFEYTPPVGTQNTNVTFTYKVTDSQGADSNAATVTLNVVERVWYVNNNLGVNGDGRSATPFNNLAAATATDDAGDYVFLYSSATTYTGGIALNANEQLLGEPHGLSVSGAASVIAAATAGLNPTITNTTAGGHGITLANAVNVQRVNVSAANTDGINGTGVTTATIGTNSNLITVSGSGGAELKLTGAAGGNIDVFATITNGGTGRAVEIQNRTAGTINLGGAVSDTGGTGVLLNSNTGATIAFGGAVTLSTGANAAFTATGGGTVSTNSSAVNTLTTAGAAALNVTNTTSGGLTFRSINANGGANGIVMSNTGSGGLSVTGTGSAGSGGTIQNTTTRGANFVSASNISLTNMNFTSAATSDFPAAPTGLSLGVNTGDNAPIHLQSLTGATLTGINVSGSAEHGINLHEVTTFSLVNSSIVNAGNGADEDGIHAFNLRGTVNVTNTTVTSSGDDNLNMQWNTPLTALPLPTATVTVSGGSYNTGVLGSGVLFGVRATSNVTIKVLGTTINNNFSGGVVADTYDYATSDIEVATSTITNNNDGIAISGNHGHTNFDVHNMTNMSGQDFVNISVLKASCTLLVAPCTANPSDGSFGTLEGYIRNNSTIVTENGHTADGMFLFNAGKGELNAVISGNVMDYAGTQRAIAVQGGQDGASTINLTATGNNIDVKLDGTGNAVNGILAQSQVADPSGAGSSLCADIGGAGGLSNTFTHSLGGTMAGGDIRLRQRFAANIAVPGYTGGGQDTTAVAAFLNSRNAEVSASTASSGGPPGAFTNTTPPGSSCKQPS